MVLKEYNIKKSLRALTKNFSQPIEESINNIGKIVRKLKEEEKSKSHNKSKRKNTSG